MAQEVIEEYHSSLSDLTFNSKPLINMLTMLAEDHLQYAPEIVRVIEEHISKASDKRKLPFLYLIDSIVKNLPHSMYPALFTQNIVTMFCAVFEKVDEKTRGSLFKLRQTWSEIFPNRKLYAMDIRVNHIDPAWPISAPAPAPGSIHVNPKFIKQSGEESSNQAASAASVLLANTKGLKSKRSKSSTAVVSTGSSTPSSTGSVDSTPTEPSLEQEQQMRQQLIAKQQELLKLQQERLELELAETQAKIEAQKQRQKGVHTPMEVKGAQPLSGNTVPIEIAQPSVKSTSSTAIITPTTTSSTTTPQAVQPTVVSRDPRTVTRDPRTAGRDPRSSSQKVATTNITTVAPSQPVTDSQLSNLAVAPQARIDFPPSTTMHNLPTASMPPTPDYSFAKQTAFVPPLTNPETILPVPSTSELLVMRTERSAFNIPGIPFISTPGTASLNTTSTTSTVPIPAVSPSKKAHIAKVSPSKKETDTCKRSATSRTSAERKGNSNDKNREKVARTSDGESRKRDDRRRESDRNRRGGSASSSSSARHDREDKTVRKPADEERNGRKSNSPRCRSPLRDASHDRETRRSSRRQDHRAPKRGGNYNSSRTNSPSRNSHTDNRRSTRSSSSQSSISSRPGNKPEQSEVVKERIIEPIDGTVIEIDKPLVTESISNISLDPVSSVSNFSLENQTEGAFSPILSSDNSDSESVNPPTFPADSTEVKPCLVETRSYTPTKKTDLDIRLLVPQNTAPHLPHQQAIPFATADIDMRVTGSDFQHTRNTTHMADQAATLRVTKEEIQLSQGNEEKSHEQKSRTDEDERSKMMDVDERIGLMPKALDLSRGYKIPRKRDGQRDQHRSTSPLFNDDVPANKRPRNTSTPEPIPTKTDTDHRLGHAKVAARDLFGREDVDYRKTSPRKVQRPKIQALNPPPFPPGRLMTTSQPGSLPTSAIFPNTNIPEPGFADVDMRSGTAQPLPLPLFSSPTDVDLRTTSLKGDGRDKPPPLMAMTIQTPPQLKNVSISRADSSVLLHEPIQHRAPIQHPAIQHPLQETLGKADADVDLRIKPLPRSNDIDMREKFPDHSVSVLENLPHQSPKHCSDLVLHDPHEQVTPESAKVQPLHSSQDIHAKAQAPEQSTVTETNLPAEGKAQHAILTDNSLQTDKIMHEKDSKKKAMDISPLPGRRTSSEVHIQNVEKTELIVEKVQDTDLRSLPVKTITDVDLRQELPLTGQASSNVKDEAHEPAAPLLTEASSVSEKDATSAVVVPSSFAALSDTDMRVRPDIGAEHSVQPEKDSGLDKVSPDSASQELERSLSPAHQEQLVNMVPRMKEQLLALPHEVQQLLLNIPHELRDWLLSMAPDVRKWLLSIPPSMKDNLFEMPPDNRDKLLKMPLNIRDDILNVALDIRDWYLSLPDKILEFVLSMPPEIRNSLLIAEPPVRMDILNMPLDCQNWLLTTNKSVRAEIFQLSPDLRSTLINIPLNAREDLLTLPVEIWRWILIIPGQLRECIFNMPLEIKKILFTMPVNLRDEVLKMPPEMIDWVFNMPPHIKDEILNMPFDVRQVLFNLPAEMKDKILRTSSDMRQLLLNQAVETRNWLLGIPADMTEEIVNLSHDKRSVLLGFPASVRLSVMQIHQRTRNWLLSIPVYDRVWIVEAPPVVRDWLLDLPLEIIMWLMTQPINDRLWLLDLPPLLRDWILDVPKEVKTWLLELPIGLRDWLLKQETEIRTDILKSPIETRLWLLNLNTEARDWIIKASAKVSIKMVMSLTSESRDWLVNLSRSKQKKVMQMSSFTQNWLLSVPIHIRDFALTVSSKDCDLLASLPEHAHLKYFKLPLHEKQRLLALPRCNFREELRNIRKSAPLKDPGVKAEKIRNEDGRQPGTPPEIDGNQSPHPMPEDVKMEEPVARLSPEKQSPKELGSEQKMRILQEAEHQRSSGQMTHHQHQEVLRQLSHVFDSPKEQQRGDGRRDSRTHNTSEQDLEERPKLPHDDPRWSRGAGMLGFDDSEEVFIDGRTFSIKAGDAPRLVAIDDDKFRVEASLELNGIVLNNEIVYIFCNGPKDIEINRRIYEIFYHGPGRVLWIDGCPFEVRLNAPPRKIRLDDNTSYMLCIHGKDLMIKIDQIELGHYGGPPRRITIHGRQHEIQFSPPPRQILIDQKVSEILLNRRIPAILIDGKMHGIRFRCPPREVIIDDESFTVPANHPVKIRLRNRVHWISLGGPAHEIIFDGKWMEVKFGGAPRHFYIGVREHSIMLKGVPPEVEILEEIPVGYDAPDLEQKHQFRHFVGGQQENSGETNHDEHSEGLPNVPQVNDSHPSKEANSESERGPQANIDQSQPQNSSLQTNQLELKPLTGPQADAHDEIRGPEPHTGGAPQGSGSTVPQTARPLGFMPQMEQQMKNQPRMQPPGIRQPVTSQPFSSMIPSQQGLMQPATVSQAGLPQIPLGIRALHRMMFPRPDAPQLQGIRPHPNFVGTNRPDLPVPQGLPFPPGFQAMNQNAATNFLIQQLNNLANMSFANIPRPPGAPLLPNMMPPPPVEPTSMPPVQPMPRPSMQPAPRPAIQPALRPSIQPTPMPPQFPGMPPSLMSLPMPNHGQDTPKGELPPPPQPPQLPQPQNLPGLPPQPPAVSSSSGMNLGGLLPAGQQAVPQLSGQQQPPSLIPPLMTPTTSATGSPASTLPLDLGNLFSKLLSAGIIKQEKQKAKDALVAAISNPVLEVSEEKPKAELPKIEAQPEEDTSPIEPIPKKMDFKMTTLKKRYDSVIHQLYTGIQCASCGVRFEIMDTERYREHLDWHFRHNRREKEGIRVVKYRKWYYDLNNWILYDELDESEDRGRSEIFEQMISAAKEATFTLPAGSEFIQCPASTGADSCEICGDSFDQYWDEEQEDWHLRDAIQVNSKNYHPVCYEDAREGGSLEPSPSPSIAPLGHPLASAHLLGRLQPIESAQLQQLKVTLPLPQSKTPPLQQPRTPPPQQPKTPPLQQPKIAPLQQPKTPPLQQPMTPPLQQPKTAPLQQPKTPPMQQPKNPQGQQPEVTEVQHPDGPQVQQPEIPKVQQAVVPEVQQPVVPQVQQPVVPEVQQSDVPQVQQPKVTEVQQPDVPQVQQPDVPQVQQPDVPQVQQPDGPQVQQPEVPQVQKPDVPQEQQPDVFEVQEPKSPLVQLCESPVEQLENDQVLPVERILVDDQPHTPSSSQSDVLILSDLKQEAPDSQDESHSPASQNTSRSGTPTIDEPPEDSIVEVKQEDGDSLSGLPPVVEVRVKAEPTTPQKLVSVKTDVKILDVAQDVTAEPQDVVMTDLTLVKSEPVEVINSVMDTSSVEKEDVEPSVTDVPSIIMADEPHSITTAVVHEIAITDVPPVVCSPEPNSMTQTIKDIAITDLPTVVTESPEPGGVKTPVLDEITIIDLPGVVTALETDSTKLPVTEAIRIPPAVTTPEPLHFMTSAMDTIPTTNVSSLAMPPAETYDLVPPGMEDVTMHPVMTPQQHHYMPQVMEPHAEMFMYPPGVPMMDSSQMYGMGPPGMEDDPMGMSTEDFDPNYYTEEPMMDFYPISIRTSNLVQINTEPPPDS